MATSSLQSDLTCSVCLELYKEPLLLKCMHSFCRDCLLQILSTNLAAEEEARYFRNSKQRKLFRQQAGKVFECPDCRYIVTLDQDGVDGLPKNFTLRNIVENFKRNNARKASPQFPCAVCTEAPPREGVKFCCQCRICYCQDCLGQVHPRRGVLAKHVLINPSVKAIANATNKTEDSNGAVPRHETRAVDDRCWCRTCRVVYPGGIGKNDTHSRHDTLTLKEMKVHKMREMEKRALDLDQTKRKIGEMITDGEDAIVHLKEDAQKRQMEIKNYADKIREQLLNYISAKERECLTSLRKDTSSKTEKRQNQIGVGKQQLSEISHILQDIGETQEESDDAVFVKKMSAIEERLQKVQDKQIQIDSDRMEASSEFLCGLTKSLERLESAAVDNTEDVTTPGDKKTPKSSETISCPVNNITATRIPSQHYAMVELSWAKVLGHTYNIKLVSKSDSGTESALYFYDVPGDVIVHRLRFGAIYDVTVSVHNHPETESKALKVRMLEKINCPEFSFNSIKGHPNMAYSPCGKKMANRHIQSWDDDPMQKILGTVGTYEIIDGNVYWELKANYPVPYKNGDFVFDLGICSKYKVDRVPHLFKNYNAYSCTMVKRGKYREMSLEFDSGGSGPLVRTKYFNTESIHLGFFVNMDKRTFSIIDIKMNTLCCTFINVKTQMVYLPVFAGLCGMYDTDFELLTGSQIQNVPRLLMSLL